MSMKARINRTTHETFTIDLPDGIDLFDHGAIIDYLGSGDVPEHDSDIHHEDIDITEIWGEPTEGRTA